MVVVLSGFNGLESKIEEVYSRFDSDIKITALKGKTFSIQELDKSELLALDNVDRASYVIEETVILRNPGRNWVLGTMKGVEKEYLKMNKMSRFIVNGDSKLYSDQIPLAIIGTGLMHSLESHVKSRGLNFIKVLALRGDEELSKAKKEALNEKLIGVGAEFVDSAKYQQSHLIVPIDFATDILEYKNSYTALELNLKSGTDVSLVKSTIEELVGPKFKVSDKFDQNKLLFMTHKSEKWMVFLVLCFIFVLATFNMIASLTMLVLDKKKDIFTLHAMGMNFRSLRRIFINEGLLINFFGALLGIVLGLVIALGQQTFGWVELEGDAIVKVFPVKIVWFDLFWIFGTVLIVGLFTTYLPVRVLLRKRIVDPNQA